MYSRNLHRRAFTRIELGLAAFVAALSASLLLAAVNKTREAENWLRCQQNLRQIGAALHQYHEAHGVFPPAMINCGGTQLGSATASFYPGQRFKVYNHTGFMLLLPFIGKGDLYAQYDFTYPSCNASGWADAIPPEHRLGLADLGNGPDGAGTPGINAGNTAVVGARVLTYECPSDHSPALVDSRAEAKLSGGNDLVANGFAVTNGRRGNYLFNCLGSSEYTPSYSFAGDYPFIPGSKRGVFGINGAARLAELGDGLATTILVGEVRQELCTPNYVPHWGAGNHGAVMAVLDSSMKHINFPAGANPTNSPFLASECLHDAKHRPLQYHGGFGSWHPHGASFVFADGSVHFLADSMSFMMFVNLNAINDAMADSVN